MTKLTSKRVFSFPHRRHTTLLFYLKRSQTPFWLRLLIFLHLQFTWNDLTFTASLLSRLSNSQGINIQISGTTAILVIANVTEEDYGNYTCVASNRLGVQNASLFLYSKYRQQLEVWNQSWTPQCWSKPPFRLLWVFKVRPKESIPLTQLPTESLRSQRAGSSVGVCFFFFFFQLHCKRWPSGDSYDSLNVHSFFCHLANSEGHLNPRENSGMWVTFRSFDGFKFTQKWKFCHYLLTFMLMCEVPLSTKNSAAAFS